MEKKIKNKLMELKFITKLNEKINKCQKQDIRVVIEHVTAMPGSGCYKHV